MFFNLSQLELTGEDIPRWPQILVEVSCMIQIWKRRSSENDKKLQEHHISFAIRCAEKYGSWLSFAEKAITSILINYLIKEPFKLKLETTLRYIYIYIYVYIHVCCYLACGASPQGRSRWSAPCTSACCARTRPSWTGPANNYFNLADLL